MFTIKDSNIFFIENKTNFKILKRWKHLNKLKN